MHESSLIKNMLEVVARVRQDHGNKPVERITVELSEFEFVRLQEIVDYEHTWEPFYNLVIRMMTAVRRAKGFMRNGTLKQLYAYLEKGRKSLRDSAVIMIKKSDRPQELPQVAQTLLKDNLIAV